MSDNVNATAQNLAIAIDALLPQTQCTRCGYPACRPYAEAIAKGEADINQCPPGGQLGIVKLANLLGRQPKPLNPINGVEGPVKLAFIDEAACIGCTLCIQACPVDAIVGASKQMHTVIADLCTGCDLCVAPCPVDCIAMIPAPTSLASWTEERAKDARGRYESRNARLAKEEARRHAKLARRDNVTDAANSDARQALIRAAMERARAAQSAIKAKNTENLPSEIEQRIKEIDQRRAIGTDAIAGDTEKTNR
ncbi:MAG: electron transport complex subunit RsxB [Burkholderiales bacterium]